MRGARVEEPETVGELGKRRTRPTSGTVALSAAGLAILVAAVATLLGETPTPLLALTGLVTVFAFGQVVRWPMALAASVLGIGVVVVIAMHLYPLLDLPFVAANTAVLLLVAATSVAVLWRQRAVLRVPSREGLTLAGLAALVPGLAMLMVFLIELRAQGGKLAWVMKGDHIANVVLARSVIGSGGIDPAPPNDATPVTSEIAALFLAPGRGALDPSAWLVHDLHRAIEMLLVLLALTSVLAAVLVAHVVPARRLLSRAALALGAALVPWTWFVAGYSLMFGFWNAIVSLLFLVAMWLAWVEGERQPVVGSALQAVAATLLLGAWSPLVVVPGALGVALVVRTWRVHLALRGRALAAWLATVLLFVGYAALVTLPAYLAAPAGGLASDGWFLAMRWFDPVTIAVIALGVVLLSIGVHRSGWDALGTATVVAAGGLGLAYLLYQRLDAVAGLWGYYPAKFAWILSLLLPFVAARALAEHTSIGSLSFSGRAGVVLGTFLVVGAALAQIPPADPTPASAEHPAPRQYWDWRVRSAFPLVSLAKSDGISGFDGAARTLIEVSDPRDKVLLSGYFVDPARDAFVNQWLLTQATYDPGHELRRYALTLLPQEPAAVCGAVNAWEEGVTILTRNPRLEKEMQKLCGDLDFDVVVSER